MPHRPNRFACFALAIMTLSITASGAAQAMKSSSDNPDSKFEIYGGYGYWHPFNSDIDNKFYQPVSTPNATASISYYFSRYIGAQVEGGYFSGSREHAQYVACNGESCDQLVYTAEAGPVVRWPLGRITPFAHVLGGGERLNGPALQPLTWGWGLTAGGGIDYVLPWFNQHVAVRPIQADFQYAHVSYGPLVLPAGVKGGLGEPSAVKLSGGVVLRFGEPSAKQGVMLGCSTEPSTVHPGEVVNVTGSTLYLDPHKKPVYTWAASGGKVIPAGPTAAIDTTGLAPGEYTVSGHLSEGSHAKEQASCNAPFTVVPFTPPSVSCSANPSSVPSGTSVDINTVGMSPQNRPLTYSYETSAGTLTSNGPTAKLATAGLPASLITVTCNVVDDLGQSAKATTGVTVTAPSVPVVPQTQSLCSLSFARDRQRPVRVDNEAKGCLDDIALTMHQQTDAKLEIIGNADPQEHPEAAAERALNARQYLTQERGVDPSRIEVRVGDTSGRTTRDVLVPSGATFDDTDTQLFDEKTIVRHGQAYGTGHARTTPNLHKKVIHRKPAAATPATAPTPTPPPQ